MKYILIALLLVGCGGSTSSGDIEVKKDVYVVAGQSNGRNCDWSYFEDITESETIMLALGSHGISMLIDKLPTQLNKIEGVNLKAILFVHGEHDAIRSTENYTDSVESYRKMIGDVPLLISNVGYVSGNTRDKYPDELFDYITSDVKKEIKINSNWYLAFDDAKHFREWGMISSDEIHFTKDGCIMMMDAMVEAVYKLR
tara:strand:- start:3698 stop:4294 length:597 start_codon:yes stop_codon:yes gene_type:complete